MLTPDFDDIATILWRLGSMISPSTLQGQLLGRLVTGQPYTKDEWLNTATQGIDGVELPSEDEQQQLTAMFSAAIRLLHDGDLEVQLMVPDEQTDLHQRTECLGMWCQGFLMGFAVAGKAMQAEKGQQQYTEVITEALNDIAAIAQVGLVDGEASSSDEADLVEVVEYVRMAAVNIFLERKLTDKPEKTPEIDLASAVKQANKSLH